ncbi:MAG: ROK family protein, partial [Myxococcales bacterium]|nr:ROK family protein [Myxococcales bacterium]
MSASHRIGVDLGGTKIEVAALGPAGNVVLRRRIATPASAGYRAIVDAIAGLVRGVEGELGLEAPVGIGTPGTISPLTGRLKNSNTVCLNGQPLADDLGQALERDVRLANDADCLALSEASDGAGRGAASVFAVILGTGVGGGVVVRGELLRGPNGVTGEWGHNPLPWATAYEHPGPVCYCGRRGCVETFLAGGALSRELLLRTGHERTAAEVVALAERGEPAAAAALDVYVERLGKALASVINVLDPEVIVLGGG